MSVLQNPEFARRYAELARVTLNPRRHLASDALAHSEAVAATARRLGERNQQTPEQLDLLEDLGRVHDIGKITGTARPERSLAVLAECGVTDPRLLALVERHDCNLPWFQSHTRGQAPTDKAWRRLAAAVDLRLLCMFMVADRNPAAEGGIGAKGRRLAAGPGEAAGQIVWTRRAGGDATRRPCGSSSRLSRAA